ncbi:nxt3 [Acrasis kona]|uniref:Nxt3 n=1 Tax=Acrasis kona TaxID=1008807 RepID=A0AAW2YSD4_9EUKA
MSEPTPTQVGYSFVSVYYTTLIQDPHSLFKFYKDESQLTHRVNIHEEGELLATGLEDIKDRIARLVGEEEDAKVKLVFVDSQKSLDGGVFVSVEGQISFKTEEPLKKFTQSFLLVPQQPTGYFVMNDVFRFVSPSSSTAATSSEVGDLNVPSQNVAANPASVEPRRSHYASSSTSSSKLADVDEVSEPDSTDATIGASSVTGVDDSMSQMMKDVEEGGSAMNQSESAQNLNQLNEDEEEEEEEQDNSEGNESDEQAAAAQSSPTKSSQEPVVDKKETPPKTYSSWSHVVGGVEYTPSETPTTNNTQESNNSNNTNNNTSRPKREKSDRSRNENRKPRSRDEQ